MAERGRSCLGSDMTTAGGRLPSVYAPLNAPDRLVIRTPVAGDAEPLGRMHDRCSERSRTNRWLAPLRTIPEKYLAAVLAESPLHPALVVEDADHPGTLLALASAACAQAPIWELGILVEDSAQRRGLGTFLINTLLDALPPEAVLVADAFSANRPLLSRLSRFGDLFITVDTAVAHAVVHRRYRGL